MPFARAARSRLGPRPRLVPDERGFTLVEATVAMVVFAIVATGLAGMLASGVKAHSLARQRAQAKELSRAQIELVRRYSYDAVGFVGGNPAGLIPMAESSKQVNITTGTSTATSATMLTQIQYVNDPVPTSYATAANYKRVTVTVTRNRDGKRLLRSATYIAPSVRAPLGGINNAIINARVVDSVSALPFENVSVSLAAGPSAPRSDVTDNTGLVTFPALTPTSGSGYYDVTTSVFGYLTHPDDAPPTGNRFALAPSQTKDTSIRIFQQGTTVYVSIPNWTSGGTTTLYMGSSRKSAAIPVTSTSVTIDSATWKTYTNEDLVPGIPYTIGVHKCVNGSSTCSSANYYGQSTTLTVPQAYPSVMSSSFSVSLGGSITPSCRLRVHTQTSGGTARSNVRVDLKGGPSPGYYFTGKTNASGNLDLYVPPSTNGNAATYYTVSWFSTGSGTVPNVNASSCPASPSFKTQNVTVP